MTNSNVMNRRKFLKANAAALAGITMANVLPNKIFAEASKPLRVGFVGLGGRGRGNMANVLSLGGVVVPAICDIDPNALKAAQNIITKRGFPKADTYTGPEDYKKLMDRGDLDACIVSTPWDLHTPMSVYSMKAGVPVGCEVPIAYTLEECWELIETWEKTGTPCMQLENWSFRSDNLAVLNMIRQGLLGTITHAHCAYSHDCINHWYFERGTGNTRWGAQFLIDHNRAQYPTHQQGPVLSWMDINCGDYYDTLTSTATDCKSIYEFFERHYPDHPNGKRKYKQGDIVTTVVRTKKGKTIVINYDMQSPRPYDNRWTVQGTKGIYNEQRDAVYLEGVSPRYHSWEPFSPYHKQYRHKWADHASGGHGGADGIMFAQFLNAVRYKRPMPLSLYDGVLMAAIGPLSEMSIAQGSKAIKVPDFTRGKWKTRKPDFALTDQKFASAENAQGTRIGKWSSGKVSEEYTPVTYDLTNLLEKPGKFTVLFKYSSGSHQLGIEKVELLANGKVIATEAHRGVTGVRPENNGYQLELPSFENGTKYQVKAYIRSEGGTDSNGSVYLVN